MITHGNLGLVLTVLGNKHFFVVVVVYLLPRGIMSPVTDMCVRVRGFCEELCKRAA